MLVLAADERWIIDGNYGVVRDLVWARATTILWLDPPLPVVMGQVLWRSLSRAVTRRELWNGNREQVSTWLRPDHPIRWAWSTHRERRQLDARGHGRGAGRGPGVSSAGPAKA